MRCARAREVLAGAGGGRRRAAGVRARAGLRALPELCRRGRRASLVLRFRHHRLGRALRRPQGQELRGRGGHDPGGRAAPQEALRRSGRHRGGRRVHQDQGARAARRARRPDRAPAAGRAAEGPGREGRRSDRARFPALLGALEPRGGAGEDRGQHAHPGARDQRGHGFAPARRGRERACGPHRRLREADQARPQGRARALGGRDGREGGSDRQHRRARARLGPPLASEYLVIGAHYDHIGVDAWGRIGCGADDNGSGSAGLLELAEAMALAKPKRSILVAWFSAEEVGLDGSKAFCENPPVAMSSIAAMLNVDMIGRLEEDEVYVIGSHVNKGFEDVLKAAKKLKPTQIKKVFTDKGVQFWTRSDHFNFHEKGVPALFFFEGAIEADNPDYHVFTDTVDKLSTTKMARITRFMFNTAWLIANEPERPPAPH
ncbi:MAG: M20/M25/M40 family metallo-hydrolase [Planctomycetes bacterium]|nr:M20/M25/M40 family metallo-hydrolase [Planctomycetota bacterium]